MDLRGLGDEITLTEVDPRLFQVIHFGLGLDAFGGGLGVNTFGEDAQGEEYLLLGLVAVDVAARAGVSRTTVSFVLNDRDASISPATRERVLEAARQLDYHPHAPARQLAGGRSQTVGLVLRQSPEQVAGDALLASIAKF